MLKKLKFDADRGCRALRGAGYTRTMRTAGTTRRMSYMPSWTSRSRLCRCLARLRLPAVDCLTSKWYLPMPHIEDAAPAPLPAHTYAAAVLYCSLKPLRFVILPATSQLQFFAYFCLACLPNFEFNFWHWKVFNLVIPPAPSLLLAMPSP